MAVFSGTRDYYPGSCLSCDTSVEYKVDIYVILRATDGWCIIYPLSSIMQYTNKRSNGEKASIRTMGVECVGIPLIGYVNPRPVFPNFR